MKLFLWLILIYLMFTQLMQCKTVKITPVLNQIVKYELSKTDSTNIIFKAQLLTLTRYGVYHQDSVIQKLKNQQVNLVSFPEIEGHFIFIKIEHNQDYVITSNRDANGKVSCYNQDCKYMLAFGLKDSKYYKLRGFSENHFVDFYKNYGDQLNILLVKENIDFINFDCYYNKYLSKKRKYNNTDCNQNFQDDCNKEIKIY